MALRRATLGWRGPVADDAGMDRLLTLAQQQPLLFVHLLSALGALALGLVLLARRKGTASHRGLGWAWVLLMGTAAVSSVFIGAGRLPNLYGLSPIHLLTALVLVQLPLAVRDARQGRVAAHRQRMRGLYIGGCVVAGLFTLLPGRFLGSLLWGSATAVAL